MADTTNLPELGRVARTMLWTLHARAAAAKQGRLDDPEAIRWAAQLGPALGHRFGRPDLAFALRAREFDARLQAFLDENPGATVISLGEGLETQRFRVRGYGRWVSVDLAESIAVRERFVTPDETHRHRAESATDLLWLDDMRGPTFVVAQGLFMYLPEPDVARLVTRWADEAEEAGGALLFDVVPRWVSALSQVRVPLTPTFRLPVMPWGIAAPALDRWLAQTLGSRPHHRTLSPLAMPSGPIPWAGKTSVAHVLRPARAPLGAG